MLRWDRASRLRPVALQDAEADDLLPGMDTEERMRSWHLVEPDGTVHSAGAALPPLLRMLPGGRPLAALAATAPGLTSRAYEWIARNRAWPSRLVGAGARRRADAVIERRRRALSPSG
jgi:predicted DCC family thiol-disulfide oxidoreductase YuxK